MGYQIIKQPNGKLAIFSSYEDEWVMAEASAEEVSDYFAEMAEADSRRRTAIILEHIANDEPSRAYAQFALTFKRANQKHNEQATKVFKKGEFIGFPKEKK